MGVGTSLAKQYRTHSNTSGKNVCFIQNKYQIIHAPDKNDHPDMRLIQTGSSAYLHTLHIERVSLFWPQF